MDILPFDIQGDLLTIRFEYKAVNKKEKQSDYITQAVEKIQNFAISDEFQGIFKAMPTEKNKNRTLLEKYLTDYTAKNTADYFIHKNLGKFLNQELDFYIKNEVMNLDNIQDSTDFLHIEQNLQTIKTIKIVAKEIIAFLAQLEDFQKKLWLKKKFVAGCHYLITLDHLNEAQIQAALDNPKQTSQWQALFNVNTSSLNTVELCKNYPHLVVDTSLFEPKFQANILSNLHDLDEKTNGLLIHSDNFQALNLLQERYKEQVKCIYIDPPYNTNATPIIYKNGYKHSSWNSLLLNRMEMGLKLASNSAIQFTAIDHAELFNLGKIQDDLFTELNRIAIIPIQHNPKGRNQAVFFSENCEYMFCYAKDITKASFNQVAIDQEVLDTFTEKDDIGRFRWENFVRARTSWSKENKPNNWYSIYVSEDLSELTLEKKDGYFEILPVTNQGEFTWKNIPSSFEELNVDGYFKAKKENGKIVIYHKYREQQVFKNFWSQKKYQSEFNGTNLLKAILGENPFSFPKSIYAVLDSIKIVSSKNDIILDYFAGSGTTAHAVINLNREDNGNRKYILVEQGEYFDSVLKPRVQKVIFAKEWKDGKPQTDNGEFGGVSQIVKVLKLESYEDTLNNLELRKPAQDLADMGLSETVQNDYLLHYMLDVESRDSLLNTQHFTKPFDYQLNIATTSAGAYEAKTIDLVETFNYLIGLTVSEINDKRENGLVMVQGINTSGEKTLVIWRDCEKYDYDRLNDYLNRHKINPQESEFDVVYINGDHNVPTVFAGSDESIKTLKVRSIEAEFLQRMFE